jgi:hypothetical protein
MVNKSEENTGNNGYHPVNSAQAAFKHLRDSIAAGKHWYIALLEAIGMWHEKEEHFDGQQYLYIINGEAFDWILLAERLCGTVPEMIPEREKNDLLFRNIPPIDISIDEFKRLIGAVKYRQYLNYFYGITAEEALVQAVREEVRKERHANGLTYVKQKEEDEVSLRIYEATFTELWKKFRKSRHSHPNAKSNLTEMKEFSYWCFKYRVDNCEKAKVASDTQKALQWLKNNRAKSYTDSY